MIIGLFLIMLGVVSHSTRRAGRRERLVMDRANTKKVAFDEKAAWLANPKK